LDQIALTKDPLVLVCALVLESGGNWIDIATVDIAFLFESKGHGVHGFGMGASAEIGDWTANAKAVFLNKKTTNEQTTRT
jgi:hypothetical protein